jgi:hypothetical protein
MADTAAHLVDRVIPRVPVRQWVLSVPRPIRYLLARDAKLLGRVRRIFVSEVFRDLRRRAGVRRAAGGRPGAVTGVQRFGSALNLNVHFHSIVLDGLYLTEPGGTPPRFRRLPAPSRDDLDRVLSRARLRILRLLVRRGFLPGLAAEEGPADGEGEPSVFDAVQAASIQERIGLDPGGRRVPVLGTREGGWEAADEKPFCVMSGDGWSLQAGVRIRAGDRAGLERLCRYVLRPALSVERLERLPDGRVTYGFRKPRYDGATHVVLSPMELLEKLAALVAPPRAHLVCYDGVLAPHARARPAVVAGAGGSGGLCGHGGKVEDGRVGAGAKGKWPGGGRGRGGGRTAWAELMARAMGLDVLSCPRCGGRMEVLACITDRGVAARMLRAMGLPAEAPEAAPRPRPPPELEFDFVQES